MRKITQNRNVTMQTISGVHQLLTTLGLTLPSSVSGISVSGMSVSDISDSVSDENSGSEKNTTAITSAIEANTKKTEGDRDTQSETETHRQRQTETDRILETEAHRNLPRNDTETDPRNRWCWEKIGEM